MDVIPLKRCRHCGVEKPRSAFGPRARGKDGLQAQCRDCNNRYSEKYRLNNLEKTRTAAREYQRRNRGEQQVKWADYSSKNRERLRAKGRAYYQDNREAARIRWKNYSARNREKLAERNRKWSEANKARANQRRVTWGKRTGYDSEKSRRRYAQIRAGSITLEQWQALLQRYDHKCLCCGKGEPEVKITLDHVVPLVLGGEHCIENAQPLCMSCNSRKRDRIIDYRNG